MHAANLAVTLLQISLIELNSHFKVSAVDLCLRFISAVDCVCVFFSHFLLLFDHSFEVSNFTFQLGPVVHYINPLSKSE